MGGYFAQSWFLHYWEADGHLGGDGVDYERRFSFLIDNLFRKKKLTTSSITSIHFPFTVKKGDEYHKYVVKKLRTIELLDSVSVREWRKELLIKLPEPQDCCIPDDSRVC